MSDFLEMAFQMNLWHIMKEICDYLPKESILNMMCVCKAWRDILTACGVADQLHLPRSLSGGLSKWKLALSGNLEFKTVVVPEPFIIKRLDIAHNLVFCQFDRENEFCVYKMVRGSLRAPPKWFDPGYDGKIVRFCGSVNFHQNPKNAALFGAEWSDGGCMIGNFKNGSLKVVFGPGACSHFIFNRDYLMVVVDERDVRFLQLYKLIWRNGNLRGKILVEEIDLGLSEWYYVFYGPRTDLEALGKLVVFISAEDCTATAWTFDRGQLAEFQSCEQKLFDPAPDMEEARVKVGRVGSYLVFTVMPDEEYCSNISICQITFNPKKLVCVKAFFKSDYHPHHSISEDERDGPHFYISEVVCFGNSDLMVEWSKEIGLHHYGQTKRSLMPMVEVLRHENLESLLSDNDVDKGLVDLYEFFHLEFDPLGENKRTGGCQMCIISSDEDTTNMLHTL